MSLQKVYKVNQVAFVIEIHGRNGWVASRTNK